jgi:ATP-binding cassette, subfamily F, member 3
MAFLQLNKISLAFGDRDVLKNIDMRIASGDRIALTGANGSGKSSLLKIAAGLSSSDGGERSYSPGVRITYLPQTGLEHAGKTLRDEAEEAFAHVHRMLAEKAMAEERLAGLSEGSGEIGPLLERQHHLEEAIGQSGYYRRDQQISEVLTGLGFSTEEMAKDAGSFSGGWQMRIALAKALLTHPDLLLLDEPTNYLDLEARDWLQEFLGSFQGGIVLVSHDRYFLDSCVNRVSELFMGAMKSYTGNYSAYLKQRTAELEQLKKAYLEQKTEIDRLETFIQRFRYNSSKAALVQSRVKQLEKIEPIEIPESMKEVRFSFPDPPHSGKKVAVLSDVSRQYGSNLVFSGVDLEVERGDKLSLVGMNGAGKSTLMRILAGVDTDFEGEMRLGSGVKIGYFSQDIERQFTEEHSIYAEAESQTPTELIPSLRGLLGAFLFRGDDIYKSVRVLSGGEKSRLALLKLLLNPVNLLVLDEPTNHLDLQTKEVLLNVLREYRGTIIFVSHDRYFLDQLADKVYEIEGGSGRLFPGDYEYYRSVSERYRSAPLKTNRRSSEDDSGGKSDSQMHREQLKALKADARRLEREEAALMETMDGHENRLAELEAKLADPGVYSVPAEAVKVQKEIGNLQKSIRETQEQWEKTAEKLAEAESSLTGLKNGAGT